MDRMEVTPVPEGLPEWEARKERPDEIGSSLKVTCLGSRFTPLCSHPQLVTSTSGQPLPPDLFTTGCYHHPWPTTPGSQPLQGSLLAPASVPLPQALLGTEAGVLARLCQVRSCVRSHLLLIPAREHTLVPRMSPWVAATAVCAGLHHSPSFTCANTLAAPGFRARHSLSLYWQALLSCCAGWEASTRPLPPSPVHFTAGMGCQAAVGAEWR